MSESKFVQKIEDRAELRRARIAVQQALEYRFGTGAGAEFTTTLTGIQDLDQLSELLRLAIQSRGITGFRRALARLREEGTGLS